MPGQEHQDGADADVAGREGCRGTLAGGLGVLHEVVEETIGIAWRGQALGMVVEIVAHVGEDALHDGVETDSLIIERRADHGQEDKDDVEEEERCHDDKRCMEELVVAAEEIVE